MTTVKPVILTQDLSAIGNLSLAVAIPIYQISQIPIAILPTSILSTQTEGFGTPAKLKVDNWLERTLTHWQSQKINFFGISIGYLGESNLITPLTNFIKQANFQLVVFDPVMGDDGQLYPNLTSSYLDELRRLCNQATVMTPNWTELQLLAGLNNLIKEPNLQQVNEVLRMFYQRLQYSSKIVVTGIPQQDRLLTIWGSASTIHQLTVTKRPGHFYGSGDVFAAILGNLLYQNINFNAAVIQATKITLQAIDDTQNSNRERRFGMNISGVLQRLAYNNMH